MKGSKILTIPGSPVSQGRPRLARSGHCFDPNWKQKKQVREIVKQIYIEEFLQAGHVSFIFCMPISKTMLKKGGCLNLHTKKPDVDNLIKFYLDCMTGIVWEDDCSVSIGSAVKVYSAEPKTIISLRERTPLDIDLDALQFCESPSYERDCLHDF